MKGPLLVSLTNGRLRSLAALQFCLYVLLNRSVMASVIRHPVEWRKGGGGLKVAWANLLPMLVWDDAERSVRLNQCAYERRSCSQCLSFLRPTAAAHLPILFSVAMRTCRLAGPAPLSLLSFLRNVFFICPNWRMICFLTCAKKAPRCVQVQASCQTAVMFSSTLVGSD